MINLRGIGYFGITVPDRAAWKEFATNVVGLQPSALHTGEDNVDYFKADDRTWRFAAREGEQGGIEYIGFEVADSVAFAEAKQHLTDAGVEFEDADDELLALRGVQAMVHFSDTEDNRLEIFWGPTRDGVFASPAGVPAFMTEGGLGHGVLMVKDLPAALEFYARALGMKTSDFMNFGPDMAIHFLRCTQRHHSIALSAVGPVSGTHHIALELHDIDEVGAAQDRAMNAGHPITASIGRHKNDKMLGFYMRSPAGFEIEIGTDAVLVDDETWIANEFTGGDTWGHHGLTAESLRESLEANG